MLIRDREQQLGFRLFDRTTRHVQLTPLGAELLAVSQGSVHALDTVVARLRRTARGRTRSISVGVTPLVGANVLPPAIREFRRQHPEVGVRSSMPGTGLRAGAPFRFRRLCGFQLFEVSHHDI
jgi:DNA-binding transcriptional LysR family regulator